MIEIKGIGSYDSIPELASYVIDENINMLDDCFNRIRVIISIVLHA